MNSATQPQASLPRASKDAEKDTGKEGSKTAMRQTLRILPSGNRVPPTLPFEMPNDCRILTAAQQRIAVLADERHPETSGQRKRRASVKRSDRSTTVLRTATIPKRQKTRRRKRRTATLKKKAHKNSTKVTGLLLTADFTQLPNR